MSSKDKVSAILFICLAVFTCWQSITMGFGGWARPGAGFFPFISGLGFGVLALILLLRSRVGKHADKTEPGEGGISWKPFVITFICLIGYTLIIDTLGFTSTTFLFIGLCCVRSARSHGHFREHWAWASH